MRRRKRRRLIQEIPQASLPDMAFLLLIFFISATVFGVEHGLPLVLPSAKRSPRISVEPTEVFRIQARADGTVMAEDRVVQVAEIETLLRGRNATRLARQQSELIVIVEIHPDAAYELMVSILDQIWAAGSRRVALRSLEE
jgi:biopolymer transport protein ExbD